MPLLKFSFEPDLYLDPITKKPQVNYRPYVFISLKYKKKVSPNKIRALVDSGADYNTFPSSFAKELGIDVTNGIKHMTTGIGGQVLTVYGHRLGIVLDNKEINTYIFFGKHVTIPLLGRDGFFNYFNKVSFKIKEKRLELKH